MIITQVTCDPSDLTMSEHDAMATAKVTTDGERIATPTEGMWSVLRTFGLVGCSDKVHRREFHY